MARRGLARRWAPVTTPLQRDLWAGLVASGIGSVAALAVLVGLSALVDVGVPMWGLTTLAGFLVGDAASEPGFLAAVPLLAALAVALPGVAWGVVLGVGANALDARRGPALWSVAGVLATAAAVLHLGVVVPALVQAGFIADPRLPPVAWGVAAHVAWAGGACTFTWAWGLLWGLRARNRPSRRRFDPVDPLGA